MSVVATVRELGAMGSRTAASSPVRELGAAAMISWITPDSPTSRRVGVFFTDCLSVTCGFMNTQFNRAAIYISLVLSLAFVVRMFLGTNYYFESVARQPLSDSTIDSRDASLPVCAELVENLPDRIMEQKRSDLVEPAPDGVAAWAEIPSMATVLRCGVDMPLQYTDYSETEDIEGSQWLEVRDMTEGSTLTK